MNGHASAIVHLVVAPLLFVAIASLPDSVAELPVRCSLGLLVWMSWWWVARPVHLAVTAFLPLAVMSLFDVVPIDELLPAYANQLVILLLGANILTTAWGKWGLDRRVALLALDKIGSRGDRQIVVWFLLAAALSAVLPNTVVAAAMIPIAVAMLRFVGIEDLWENRFGSALLIAIAWGTSAGGMATPLGGAPNLLAVDFLQKHTGHEFLFATWVTRMLPLTAIVCIAILLYLRFTFPIAGANLDRGGDFVRGELDKLGPVRGAEKWCILLLACPIILSFSRELYAAALPNLRPPFVFLTFGLLAFIVRHRGEPLLRWEEAQGKMMWGLIYLFAGSSALGQLLSTTGTASYIADLLVPYADGSDLRAILVFSAIAIVLTQVTSNTATVAIIIPIAISTLQSLERNPIPCVYIVVAVANCGFALPSSAGGPAVAAGYGANLRMMFANGLGAALLAMILLAFCGYMLWSLWPAFGVA